MRTPALMVCKGFLNRCSPSMKEELVMLLSPADRKKLAEIPNPTELKKDLLKWNLLDHIDISWIAPYLRTLTESEIRLFLACLSHEMSQKLQKLLGFHDEIPHLTEVAKKGLRTLLLSHILQNQELIPVAFLPEHPLNFLIELPHKNFSNLILFLGLHDLSFEMRQIISTAELKKIFSSLSHKEGEYLQTLLLHKEPLVFKRLFLQKWDRTREGMQKILEERGLHRLAHALYSADDNLVRYIAFALDMHKAALFIKYRQKPEHERAESLLQDQIHRLLQFLNVEEIK